MPKDFMMEVLQQQEDDPSYWWDMDRVPVDIIDKRVTDLLNLRGKKAVVTGGAGLNLGQACVNRLAGLGADVAVVDLKPGVVERGGYQRWDAPPDADAVAAEASEKWGANVIAVYGDVMEWDSVHQVMSECHDRLGGIDILVNNATNVAAGPFENMTKDDIDMSLNGVLAGPLYCIRAALDYMIPQGSGRIINIGTEASLSAMPALTLYGALKAGLGTFTRFCGKEVAGHGIQMLGVHPGSMWGPNRPIPTSSSGGAATLYPRGRTAIQRYELPEEVANMVAFLASDAASAMVGNMVEMGGGMSI